MGVIVNEADGGRTNVGRVPRAAAALQNHRRLSGSRRRASRVQIEVDVDRDPVDIVAQRERVAWDRAMSSFHDQGIRRRHPPTGMVRARGDVNDAGQVSQVNDTTQMRSPIVDADGLTARSRSQNLEAAAAAVAHVTLDHRPGDHRQPRYHGDLIVLELRGIEHNIIRSCSIEPLDDPPLLGRGGGIVTCSPSTRPAAP